MSMAAPRWTRQSEHDDTTVSTAEQGEHDGQEQGEHGGTMTEHSGTTTSTVVMSSYSRPASRAGRMAISLRVDACLRAVTMGELFGTRRTTEDDAFPFFPLAPDDAEAVKLDVGVTGRAGAGASPPRQPPACS
jgi:hypothetical protein